MDMPQTGSTTSASTGASGGVELVDDTALLHGSCCRLASNFVLQLFAQK